MVPRAATQVRDRFHELLREAGIDAADRGQGRLAFHSTRHTFGSRLGAAGVDGATLQRLMGHAKITTTQRYLHTERERMRVAVDTL